ncbi:MAG: T9SS type A sorting domain-containing protein [Bacteroidota bacterium]
MKKTLLILCPCLFLFAFKANAQVGNLDKTFGTNGKVSSAFQISNVSNINSIKLQADGKIIVLGSAFNDSSSYIIARYLSNGTLDNSFSDDGYLVSDFGKKDNYCSEVIIHANGQMTIVGRTGGTDYFYDLALARLNDDGTYDNTFGNGGKLIIHADTVEYNFSAANIQSDNKIVLAGYGRKSTLGTYDFMVMRLNTDGSVDSAFATNGKLRYGYTSLNASVRDIALDANGKLIVVGGSIRGALDSDFAIARINTDGTLDTDFSLDGKATIVFNNNEEQGAAAVTVQKDGKIVMAGSASYQGRYGVGLTRMNDNGTQDNTFSQDGLQTRRVYNDFYANDMALDSAGRIFVCGQMYASGKSMFAIMAFNADGSYNNNFGYNGLDSFMIDSTNTIENCMAMAIQKDQKIIVVGNTTQNMGYGGKIGMARYNKTPFLGILNLNKISTPVLVYPNPVTDNISLRYTLAHTESMTVTLTDIQGKILMTYTIDEIQTKGEHTLSLNLPADLAKGQYLICLSSSKELTTVKIVK